MSGAFIVHKLLSDDEDVIDIVPVAKIHYGFVPVASVQAMPALLVREISGVQRNTLGMTESTFLQTDRVQVDVFSKTYLEMRSLLDLVRKACPNTRGTVATFDVQSVVFEGRGPDLSDPDAQIFNQSIDLMVTWRAGSS